MPQSRIAELDWLFGLSAVAWLAAFAIALAAALSQIFRLRKSLRAAIKEASTADRKLALAKTLIEDARARELERDESIGEYLSRARHDLLGDLNVASGFLLLLKPDMEGSVSAEKLDYFQRALAALDRAIAAASLLRGEELAGAGLNRQSPGLTSPAGEPENMENSWQGEAAT